jgi:hypothetical protein
MYVCRSWLRYTAQYVTELVRCVTPQRTSWFRYRIHCVFELHAVTSGTSSLSYRVFMMLRVIMY